MGAYTNILRLTRPVNLVIVIFTMIVVRYAVIGGLTRKEGIGMEFPLTFFEFMLLVIAAVMLTAAGNIINDYFDQKVDRVNRPERVIIGKKVKRRVAIVLHQVLNGVALIIALYLSYRTSFWWPFILPVTISVLLWWYSPVFKKRSVSGNLVVAFCTACVPFWAAVYDIHGLRLNYADMMIYPSEFFYSAWLQVIVISAFAFVLTMAREAVKDMEDIEGDEMGGYTTLPILRGIPFTKTYVMGWLVLFVIMLVIVMFTMKSASILTFIAIIGFVFVPVIATMLQLRRANGRKSFYIAGLWIKAIMLGGLISLVTLY